MPMYQKKCEQRLACGLDEIWEFISSPQNLKEITPDYMGFDITSVDLPDKMYPGMIISYKVSPLLGLKTSWVTEITHVIEKRYFVDEQRVGPYALWHHQHHVESIEGGVLMTDIVSYRPPMALLGAVANSILIKRKLDEIFAYREGVLERRFGRLV